MGRGFGAAAHGGSCHGALLLRALLEAGLTFVKSAAHGGGHMVVTHRSRYCRGTTEHTGLNAAGVRWSTGMLNALDESQAPAERCSGSGPSCEQPRSPASWLTAHRH